MISDRFFLLTGTFGSGKSTLLEHLQLRGIWESSNRHERYWLNSEAFREMESGKRAPALVELMLSRMLDAYRRSETLLGPVLFEP